MNKVDELIHSIRATRTAYLFQLKNFGEEQGARRPSPEAWNAVEITEHLYWAEHGGILGMWKTLYAIRQGSMARTLSSDHQNMTIQEIINRTWKPKEQVPAVAAPRMGGTLVFWREALGSLQPIVECFGSDIKPDELRLQAHPHPISGAMDFQQRLEFIAFHIKRHHEQVSALL